MNIQPKPYMSNFRLRKKAYGTERRRNMDKIMLEHGTPFPLTVEFKDIDEEFNKWVGSLDITYEDKRLPIFKLFSNQRIGEYAQSWQHVDEVGNLVMNFFTVTRENNPKQGQNQGGSFNIPGNRNYPMFIKPTLQDNGAEAYEMYSMRQPFCVDFIYTLTLITNKYELLNEVNQRLINEFKALECYIAPNGHYMPMKLEDISDDSEYSIDDRKYYSQSYRISLMGYIIREEDLQVTKLPSRIVGRMLGSETKDKWKKATVQIEEDYEDWDESMLCPPEEKERYVPKVIKLTIVFPLCSYKTEFEIDTTFSVTEIKTTNIYDFILRVNGEKVDFEEGVDIYKGDMISVEIERDDILGKETELVLLGDSEDMVDTEDNSESILDAPVVEEDITFNV